MAVTRTRAPRIPPAMLATDALPTFNQTNSKTILHHFFIHVCALFLAWYTALQIYIEVAQELNNKIVAQLQSQSKNPKGARSHTN